MNLEKFLVILVTACVGSLGVMVLKVFSDSERIARIEADSRRIERIEHKVDELDDLLRSVLMGRGS